MTRAHNKKKLAKPYISLSLSLSHIRSIFVAQWSAVMRYYQENLWLYFMKISNNHLSFAQLYISSKWFNKHENGLHILLLLLGNVSYIRKGGDYYKICKIFENKLRGHHQNNLCENAIERLWWVCERPLTFLTLKGADFKEINKKI